jgi:hypothetical protein
MKAKEFLNIWKNFHNQKLNSEIDKFHYYEKKLKTHIILDGIDQFIIGEYQKLNKPMKSFREDYTRDLTFVHDVNENVVITKSYHDDPLPSSFGHYYKYEIILEHENDILLCQQEMIKLTYFKSPLKVLITYCWDNKEEDKYKVYREKAKNNFKDIIEKSNKDFPENISTEYLLIIGQKFTAKYEWYCYAYKYNGEIILEDIID